jgi:hypothetical protein
VQRTGKNLLSDNYTDYSMTSGYAYLNGVVPKGQTARFTFTDKDTSVDISGCAIGFVYNDLSSERPKKYRWVIDSGTMQSDVSNTSAQDYSLLCSNVFVYPNKEDAFNKLFARYNIMVELGSTATAYEPYKGHPITIDLGQTVYGANVDVINGELVVDRAQIASYNGETLPSTWISDRDVYASGTTPTIGAQVVYKLASPITYTLTPQEITSLLGTNNLWADTGNSEVEYRADTKMYITKKITEAVSALS